ncbi:DUF294 nucleotidyltransferase-like domain-containing protein [Aneurinibacillus terranovensis]|uniref:DUF294 nucleotidyltransferase-like domain-containing protein n=1 Tax=Aneurinibacillus terranovensis TaxID=278991 RepID=UPI000412D38A|nr:DUF294 nucleotidyltransferase-like domain-containing protein [Aneurinibacillus terranovensis]
MRSIDDRKEWEALTSQVANTRTIEELKKVQLSLSPVLQSMQCNSTETCQIYLFLSHIHDVIMQKALQHAEQLVIREGTGSPPEEWSWVIMGSGGRREHTVWTDQDNGIVYRLSPSQDPKQAEAYVRRMAEYGVNNLQQVGYPLCQGNVMATNKKWCKSEDEWKNMLKGWEENLSPDDVRFLLIAADFRILYGSKKPGESLRKYLCSLAKNNRPLLKRLAQHAAGHTVPLSIFGQVLVERWGENAGKFNLKRGVYMQFVNCIRLFALTYGIAETSTIERIGLLEEKGVWDHAFADSIRTAFSHILHLRLQSHLYQEQKTDLLDHHINLKKIPADDFKHLRQAMKQIKKVQHEIQRQFIRKF